MNDQPEWASRKIKEANLNGLKRLDLSGIGKVDRIESFPIGILALNWLESLDLKENNLAEIPDSIEVLRNLRIFKLGYNRLKSVPDSIIKLADLSDLDLSGNKLTEIPDSVTKLKSLTKLFLGYNLLTEIPDSIINLINLAVLELSGNNITEIPESVIKLPNLIEIYLVDVPLKTPPAEIASKGVEAIRGYYRQRG